MLFPPGDGASSRARARSGGAGGWAWLLDARHALGMSAGLALALALLIVGGAWSPDGAAREGLPVLAALSNQSWLASLTLADLRHNSAPILGWTNEEHFPSTNRSLDKLSTNDLLPRL